MSCPEPPSDAQDDLKALRDVPVTEDITSHLRRVSTGHVSVDIPDTFNTDEILSRGTQQKHIPGVSEPLSSTSLSRQMSVKSKNTLTTLDTLEGRLDTISGKVQDVEEKFAAFVEGHDNDAEISGPDIDRLKSVIAQLNGDIERLQFEGVDAVLITELQSGKEKAKTQRKLLTYRIEDLMSRLEKTKTLLGM